MNYHKLGFSEWCTKCCTKSRLLCFTVFFILSFYNAFLLELNQTVHYTALYWYLSYYHIYKHQFY